MKTSKIILSCLSTTVAVSATGLSSCSFSLNLPTDSIVVSYASSDSNCGTIDDSHATKSVAIDTKWKDIEKPTYVAKEGYKFVGWFISNELVNDDYVISSNVAAVARFESCSYSISWCCEPNVGYIDESGATKQVLPKTRFKDIQKPTYVALDGYAFSGWYINDELVEDDYIFTSNVIIFAHFASSTCNVTFLSDGNGELQGQSEQTIAKGMKWSQIVKPSTQPKYGFDFDAWYNGETKIEKKDDFEINQNMSFVAHFTNMLRTVKFISGGNGNLGPYYLVEQDIHIGTKWKEIEKPETHAEDSYFFEGWYKDDEKIGPDDDFTIDDNITIVARFAKKHHVDFISGGHGTIDTLYSSQDVLPKTMWLDIPKPETRAEDNYDFVGWYKDDELIEEDENFPITTDLSIVAHFEINCKIDWSSGGNGEVYISYYTTIFAKPGTPWSSVIKPSTSPISWQYVFDNWYIGDEIVPDNYIINSNVSIVARFKDISATVTFESNGHGQISSYRKKQKVEKGVTKWFEIGKPDTSPDTGYMLEGWYINNVKMDDQSSYVFTDDNTCVIANFVPIADTCKISFIPGDNGHLQGKDIIHVDAGTYWNSITNKPTPVGDTGYRFKGWYINNVKIETNIQINEDTIVVALFEFYYKTISYGTTEGGTIDATNATKQVRPETTWHEITLPIVNEETGFEFDGWYVGDTKISPSYTINTDIVAIARFYRVDLVVNFSTDGNAEIDSADPKTFVHPNTLWKQVEKPKFKNIKTNYEFEAWYDGVNKIEDNAPITTSINAVAHFINTKPTCSISWMSSGHGKVSVTDDTITSIEVGTKFGVVSSHAAQTIPDDGYAFDGWYINDQLADDNYVINENIVIVAKFKLSSFNISYASDGWGTVDDSQATKHVDKVTKWKDITPAIATPNSGFEFIGWYLVDGTKMTDNFEINQDITVFAKFTEKYYDVKYYSDNQLIKTIPVLKDTRATSIVPPEKTGFDFKGWCIDQECTQFFDFTTPITEEKTLYAKWEKTPEPIDHYTFHFKGTHCKLFGLYEYSQDIDPGEEEITFTLVPDLEDGYILPKSISVPGVKLEGDKLTILKMDDNYTVNVDAVIWEAMMFDGYTAHYFRSLDESYICGDNYEELVKHKIVALDGKEYERETFNIPLILNPQLKSIGKYFLGGCNSYNHEVDLPNTLTKVDIGFMYCCQAMVSKVNIGDLSPNIFEASEHTLSTNSSLAPMYVTGVPIVGTNSDAFLTKFYSITQGPYRKLKIPNYYW